MDLRNNASGSAVVLLFGCAPHHVGVERADQDVHEVEQADDHLEDRLDEQDEQGNSEQNSGRGQYRSDGGEDSGDQGEHKGDDDNRHHHHDVSEEDGLESDSTLAPVARQGDSEAGVANVEDDVEQRLGDGNDVV